MIRHKLIITPFDVPLNPIVFFAIMLPDAVFLELVDYSEYRKGFYILTTKIALFQSLRGSSYGLMELTEHNKGNRLPKKESKHSSKESP